MEDETEGRERFAAHRKGDLGGKASSPSKARGGSPNVFINGMPAMRQGDEYEDGSILTEGSSSVFINGKPAGRISIRRNNDGEALTGSPNVFIGRNEAKLFVESCSLAYQQAREQADEILSAAPPTYPEGSDNTNRERNIINRAIRRNELINEAYAQLYRDNPDNHWAGLAAIVSSQMGCNMRLVADKYTNLIFKSLFPYPTYVMFPQWIEALGAGNQAIFSAMYPSLRMVTDQGYEQFLKCYTQEVAGKDFSEKIVDAIKALQAGKLKIAAEILAKYEQTEIAKPIYEQYASAFESLKLVSDMILNIGVDMQSLPLSRRCGSVKSIIPFTEDLTNENDRFNYFLDLYRHWDGALD